MKQLVICGGIIFTLSIAGFGQRQQTARVNGSQSSSSDTSVKSGNNSGEISLAQGTRIDGELQKTIDVKNAHVGDQVLLKTTRDIKQNGRTVVAKGATLVGRVTDVAQRTKQSGSSRLGMVFDRVRGNNLDAPINASIVSITQAANASVGDTADADVFGSTSSSTGVSRSSSSAGGGLLGGVGNTVGGLTSGVTNTAGNIVNTTGQTVGNAANGVTRTVNGIQISNSASANGSASTEGGSLLSSSKSNIRLDKGATLGLELNISTSVSASRSH
ncbi:MAG TPA: hypothetical protein VGO43_03105 [Pyrinomonadaceae bacterium]|jgi:hypothetical protein|nr:hypothetical protein [Pyrinomonadaceae bacterium]